MGSMNECFSARKSLFVIFLRYSNIYDQTCTRGFEHLRGGGCTCVAFFKYNPRSPPLPTPRRFLIIRSLFWDQRPKNNFLNLGGRVEPSEVHPFPLWTNSGGCSPNSPPQCACMFIDGPIPDEVSLVSWKFANPKEWFWKLVYQCLERFKQEKICSVFRPKWNEMSLSGDNFGGQECIDHSLVSRSVKI